MTTSASAVTCIGAITADTTLRLESAAVPGTSNPVTRSHSTGGVAHNVARNLSQLGIATRLVTVAGDDAEGRALLESARALGIDVSASALLPSRASGSYTALLTPDGALHIGAADIGICDAMDVHHVRESCGRLRAGDSVFADTNLPAVTLEWLVQTCRRDGCVLYVDAVSTAKAARLPADLGGVDTLFANRDEAAVLSAMCADTDAELMAHAIQARGVRTVVVTLGAAGLCWANAAGRGRLPTAAGSVRDVSGAGDALVAAYIAGRLRRRSHDASLRMGLRAAALLLDVPGPFSPALTREAIANRSGKTELTP